MKKNFSQEIFIIAVLTLTISFLWGYLSVYRSLKKTEKPILSKSQTQILVPNFDTSVFEELKNRKI